MSFICKKKERMAAKEQSFDYSVYTTVDAVPKEIFNADFQKSNQYLSYEYLRCVEKGNPEIKFLYYTLSTNNLTVGFACCQLVELNLNKEIIIESPCIITREILSFVSKYNQKKKFTVIVCGSIFINGRNGYALDSDSNKSFISEKLVSIIEESAKSNKHEKQIQAILFKDYYNKEEAVIPYLTNKHYSLLNTEPAMILDISSDWNNYDDYLLALKTKYRTKAKKAIKESAVLEANELSSQDIQQHLPRLIELYNAVEKKATFSLGKLDISTYVDLKESFPENFILRTYTYENNIVGFLSGFINGDVLDAHYVGLDYEYNKQYYIYQRILYDYIAIAIEKNLKRINFGRSATEIKSTIGATATEMFCYIKHRQPIQNHFLKPFTKNIKSQESKQIKPFK